MRVRAERGLARVVFVFFHGRRLDTGLVEHRGGDALARLAGERGELREVFDELLAGAEGVQCEGRIVPAPQPPKR